MSDMLRLLLLCTLPLFLLDYASKEWIVRRFVEPGPEGIMTQPVVDGFFNLVRVHNTGIAFGMANGTQWANLVFGGVAAAALLLITLLWRSNAFPTAVSRLAVALLVSGILGNLLDRLLRGYVVDFLDFYYRKGGSEHHFAAFNVADSCICVAAGLLFISAFQKTPENAPVAKQA